jgi:DNA-binding MarR family transcriptional regulator
MVVGRLARHLRLARADRSLSPSQLDVLGTVARRGPLGLSQLATLEGLNPSMLSRIAGHLEHEGLVERMVDSRDARAARLSATDKGRALHEQVRIERTQALLLALGRLTPRERLAISRALPALEALVDAMRGSQC